MSQMDTPVQFPIYCGKSEINNANTNETLQNSNRKVQTSKRIEWSVKHHWAKETLGNGWKVCRLASECHDIVNLSSDTAHVQRALGDNSDQSTYFALPYRKYNKYKNKQSHCATNYKDGIDPTKDNLIISYILVIVMRANTKKYVLFSVSPYQLHAHQ